MNISKVYLTEGLNIDQTEDYLPIVDTTVPTK